MNLFIICILWLNIRNYPPKHIFILRQTVLFRIAQGDNIGKRGPFWKHINIENSIHTLHSILWRVKFVKSFLLTIYIYDSRWRPSWKLAAILERSEHSNNAYNNINCTFHMLKTHIFFYKTTPLDHFLPSARQKLVFRVILWRSSLKMAPILKFCKAPLSSLRMDSVVYLCQIWCMYYNLNDYYTYLTYLRRYHTLKAIIISLRMY